MRKGFIVESAPLPGSFLLKKTSWRGFLAFDLELTARCNHNCRHCYINLPATDKRAREKELSLVQIKNIAEQAVSLGALWCLITGGEPLLRKDFFDIYLYLKKQGLLVSVFTNATLINEEHVLFFKKYPPRNIEVTVYGATKETYEQVTRKAGSFDRFMRGVNLLLENGIKVHFKAVALRSNVHELSEIARFCRERTKDLFRFDPFLNLRFDRNSKRNEEIRSERLTPEEIVRIEGADPERSFSLEKSCDKLITPRAGDIPCKHLFHCGAGRGSFSLSYDGFFRLCSSLCYPDCLYDLKKGTLAEALKNFVPKIRNRRSSKKEFLNQCRICPIINLCMWCPAQSALETGAMDSPVKYFCAVAHRRAEWLQRNKDAVSR